MYLHKDLQVTAMLYALFLGLAASGLRQWQRAARASGMDARE